MECKLMSPVFSMLLAVAPNQQLGRSGLWPYHISSLPIYWSIQNPKCCSHDDKQQSIKKTNGNDIQWQLKKCICLSETLNMVKIGITGFNLIT